VTLNDHLRGAKLSPRRRLHWIKNCLRLRQLCALYRSFTQTSLSPVSGRSGGHQDARCRPSGGAPILSGMVLRKITGGRLRDYLSGAVPCSAESLRFTRPLQTDPSLAKVHHDLGAVENDYMRHDTRASIKTEHVCHGLLFPGVAIID